MSNPNYPEQPQGGQYFHGMPPPPQGGVPAPLPRPKQVDQSFWLWVAAIVVSVINGVLNLLIFAPRVQHQMAERLQHTPGVDTGQLAGSMTQMSGSLGSVSLVISTAIWVLFVVMMRMGKNWARITLLVITILWGLFQVLGVASSAAMGVMGVQSVSTAIAAVELVLAVVACVLMFRPAARYYFAPGPQGWSR